MDDASLCPKFVEDVSLKNIDLIRSGNLRDHFIERANRRLVTAVATIGRPCFKQAARTSRPVVLAHVVSGRRRSTEQAAMKLLQFANGTPR